MHYFYYITDINNEVVLSWYTNLKTNLVKIVLNKNNDIRTYNSLNDPKRKVTFFQVHVCNAIQMAGTIWIISLDLLTIVVDNRISCNLE